MGSDVAATAVCRMWDTIDSQLGGITGPQTVEDEDHEQMPTAALIIIPETVSCATCGGNDAGREKRRFLGAIRRRS